MKVIGFVGPKGSGKDTAADILNKAGKSHKKLAFAGPLKDICSKVFEVPPQLFNDPYLKEKPFKIPVALTSRALRKVKVECAATLSEINPETNTFRYKATCPINGIENRVCKTPRELLQVIGTDLIRNRMYGDWHLEAAFSDKVLNKLDQHRTYCVTDIRFENEYNMLKDKLGDAFVAFYVERPEAEAELEKSSHESEKGVLKLRQLVGEENIINNDGSLKELEKNIKDNKLLKQFLKSDVSYKVNKARSQDGKITSGKFVYGPKGK